MSEMMIYTMSAIVCTVRITAVSKVSLRKIRKLQFWPKNTLRKTLRLQLEKFQNTVNVIYTVSAMSKMMV